MDEIEKLEKAIVAINAQRSLIGDDVVETMLAPISERLALLKLQQPVAERRKLVTIVFADVSGFTSLSEKIDAEIIHNYLNTLWSRLDAAIISFGGVIDKHIGDAVMALWGVDAAHEIDPERAIRAALTMQEILREEGMKIRKNIDFAHLPVNAFQMRIGINTGQVILGEVGTTHEFTALGDSVNLTARLEEAAPIGGILISHETYRSVRGVFDVTPQSPLTVKGKTEPLQTYLVIRPKPRTFRSYSRGVEGIETHLIGRLEEFEKLKELYNTVKKGNNPALVMLQGEAGVGKSRLMYEFQEWLDLLPERIIIFHGRGSESTRNLPFSLLRDVFSFRFQIADSDSLVVARKKLVNGFTEWKHNDPDSVMQANFIGQLIGFDFSTSEFIRGILDDPRQIRNRAFHYLYQFFSNSKQPIVLFLDDLQWADEGSLEAMKFIWQMHRDLKSDQMPLLTVMLTRPIFFEEHNQWIYDEKITLQPLSDPDSRTLVQEILQKIPEIPVALREMVVSVGEGNPFYIEELVKMLIDQKVIIPDDVSWQVEPVKLASARIPSTLTGVLQARLDSLPKPEVDILQRASVIGRIFWDSAILALKGNERQEESEQSYLLELNKSLGILSGKELIYAHEKSAFEPSHEYTFKHGLFREVIYETVLKRNRRIYHARIANWIIQMSGDRSAGYAGILAEHFERAEDKLVAARWYGIAGKHAEEAYAPQSALAYFQKALELTTGLEVEPLLLIEWYGGLAKSLDVQARFIEAFQAYQNMLQVSEETQDLVASSIGWRGCARAQERLGNFKASLECAENAELAAEKAFHTAKTKELKTNAQIEFAGALYAKGWALYRQGDAQNAIIFGEQVLRVCQENEAIPIFRHSRASGLKLLGAAYGMLGNFSKALNYDEEAISVYRDIGDREMVVIMLNNLGANEYFRGNYEGAELRYQEALTTARTIGLRTLEILLISNLGGARVGLKEYEKAEADLRQAISLAGKAAWLSETYCCLSEACLGQQKIKLAVEAAKKAIFLGLNSNQPEYIGIAWRRLANCASFIQNSGIAFQDFGNFTSESDPIQLSLSTPPNLYRESLNVFASTGMEAEAARTMRDWALYEQACGNIDQFQNLMEKAHEIFLRLGMDAEALKIQPFLANGRY